MSKMITMSYVLLAGTVVILDRITKLIALAWCQSAIKITSFCECVVVYNRGIVWGIFHEYPSLYIIMPSVIAAVIGCLAVYTIIAYRSNVPIFAQVALLAGACSNLMDRYLYGGVVDFIHISYGSFSWPIFNVADVAIVLGVLWLCISCSDA